MLTIYTQLLSLVRGPWHETPEREKLGECDQSSFTLWASASSFKVRGQEMTCKGSSAPESPAFCPKRGCPLFLIRCLPIF